MRLEYETGKQTPSGWIATIGSGPHRFGGSAWAIQSTNQVDTPVLLLRLDLQDQRLAALHDQVQMREVPLCSYINSDRWINRQLYQINTDSKILIEEYSKRFEDFTLGELAFPNPLPERPLSLRQMKPEEIPTDEASYWTACDSFVGGEAFIRVAGPIVWLEEAKKPKCRCGARFIHVAAVGYEPPDAPAGILGKRAFFIGEGALYFFLCPTCKKLLVLSQSS